MAEYRLEDAEKVTEQFVAEVINDTTANGTLQATVLGIIDMARKELKERDFKMWATFIRLGESIWERR